MLQSTPKLRNNGSVVKRAWDVYGKKQRDERRTAAWCCVATNRVDAVLHVLLRHYNSRYCGATTRVATALQLALLRRSDVASCKLRCCGTTICVAALLLHSGCIAIALQLVWLHCCSTLATLLQRCNSRGCNATVLRHYNSRCYSSHVVFFFWNDSWQV